MRALATAIALTEPVVAGVRPDQWTSPTPCPDWSVRQLVNHLVAGQLIFARALAGEPFEAVAPLLRLDHLGDDPVGAYQRSAGELLEVAAAPGVEQRMVRVPVGTVPGVVALHLRTIEALVHGWDVARATGQPFEVPEELAAAELAFSRDSLSIIPPDRRPFGDPQPVDDAAPAIDRLAALLGRRVEPIGT